MKTYKFIIILLFLASCNTSKIDYSKKLNIHFQNAKQDLLYEGFTELEPQLYNKKLGIYKYTFVYDENNEKEHSVILYSENQDSNVKFIEIKRSIRSLILSDEIVFSDIEENFSLDETISKDSSESIDVSNTLDNQSTPEIYHYLYESDFKQLQAQARFLNCSTNPNFLTNNFTCKNEYKVTSTSYKNDPWLYKIINGNTKQYEITITIKPI